MCGVYKRKSVHDIIAYNISIEILDDTKRKKTPPGRPSTSPPHFLNTLFVFRHIFFYRIFIGEGGENHLQTSDHLNSPTHDVQRPGVFFGNELKSTVFSEHASFAIEWWG